MKKEFEFEDLFDGDLANTALAQKHRSEITIEELSEKVNK